MEWHVRYGEYYAPGGQADVYTVAKVWHRGEYCWIGMINDDNGEGHWDPVPGPLPLNRRQAMHNCEEHYERQSASRLGGNQEY